MASYQFADVAAFFHLLMPVNRYGFPEFAYPHGVELIRREMQKSNRHPPHFSQPEGLGGAALRQSFFCSGSLSGDICLANIPMNSEMAAIDPGSDPI